MSGYFDALMRSSGVTIGGFKPAPARLEPSAIDVDVHPSPPATALSTVREVSTVQQALAPVRTSDHVAPAEPPPVTESVTQYAHERSDAAARNGRGAPEPAADSPMTRPAPLLNSPEPEPDQGHRLVRAAMRWVAADTPQASDRAQSAPAHERPLPAVREDTSVITMTTAAREDDEPQPQLPTPTPTPPAAPTLATRVRARESGSTTPLPVRSALMAPAPARVAALPREDVVEVSIGAIHVRVDAPLAQTVARPAPPPAPSATRAAGTTSARSALSRRALRRI